MASVASRWAAWERAGRRVNRVSPLAPITFPETDLIVRARIAPGADLTADPGSWSWSEISADVRWDNGNGVQVTGGRPDERGTVSTIRARMMLDNREGKYARRNPLSPYYGLLTTRTPIWVEVDPGDGGHDFVRAFVDSWPVRWQDKSLNDSYVPIECLGALGILQQTQGESVSALYRAITGSNPVHYWPMEDSSGASFAAPAAGNVPLRVKSGTVSFAGDSVTTPGSSSLPDLSGNGELYASGLRTSDIALPLGPWTLGVVFRVSTTTAPVVRWRMDGDVYRYMRLDITSTTIVLSGIQSDGTVSTIDSIAINLDDSVHHSACVIIDPTTASAFDLQIWADGVLLASGNVPSAAGRPSDIKVNPQGESGATADCLSVGHVAFWRGTVTDWMDALEGHDGEMAHERIERLCGQAGIRYSSQAVTSARMGPQPVGDVLTLLRECELADQGVLYEHDFGLSYQSRTERYNQNVHLPLDITDLTSEPEPADDNQRTVNRWTVHRSGGSATTYTVTDGSHGTDSIGVWPGQETVNLESDLQLGDWASWRAALTTVDEERWPYVTFGLHRTPDLIVPWTSAPYGARTTIGPMPANGPPDDVDAFVEGYAQRVNQRLWDVVTNLSPASPYDIAIYNDSATPGYGAHYDTAGSATTADFVAGTDTSMTVETTLGPIWTEDLDDFNFVIRVGGVDLEVTAVSGGSSPQTFTITQTPLNGVVKTIPAGSDVRLSEPSIYGL